MRIFYLIEGSSLAIREAGGGRRAGRKIEAEREKVEKHKYKRNRRMKRTWRRLKTKIADQEKIINLQEKLIIEEAHNLHAVQKTVE